MPRIFISHTSTDNDFGYPLVDQLRRELGSVDAVFYDSRGETPDGIGWEGGVHPAGYWEMDVFRELRERSVFVVLLSAESLASPWVQDEILLAWKQKNERGRTSPKVIVPVVVPSAKDLKLPDPLDLIQAVSFVERLEWTYEQAFESLLVGVRSGQTQLRPGEAEPPFELEELPRPDHFLGREADLAWVLDRLKPGTTAGITALRGLGGIGKTALAAEVVQQAFEEGRFPSGIVVQRCDDLRDPAEVLKRLLASFDPERRQPESSDLKALAEVAHKVLRGRRILVVLDNVELGLDISAVLQRLTPTGVAILLTAREQLPIAHHDTLELALLSDAAALDLFAEWFGRINATTFTLYELASARKIVAALGNHTLAVKLAGAQAADLELPLPDFADEVAAHPLNIQDQGANATLALKETLMRSVNALPTTGELGDVRRFFAALAAFAAPARDPNDPDHVTLVPSLEFGRRAAKAAGEALGRPEPDRALDLLLRRALLDKNTDETLPAEADRERLRLHPLLRELATEILDDATRAAASLTIATFYADYASAIPNAALTPDADSIAGALEWAQMQAPTSNRELLVVLICYSMAEFWRDRSRVRESLRYLPWGVEGAQTLLGEPPTPAASKDQQSAWRSSADRLCWLLINDGYALQFTGRLDEAVTRYEACLSLAREADLKRREGVSLNVLGQVAQARGRPSEAEAYYQESLRLRRITQERRNEGAVLGQLGQVAQARGRLEEAQGYYQQSLAVLREVQDRRGEGVTLGNLGQVAQARGRLEEAEGYFQQSLAVLREVQDRGGEGVTLGSLGQVAQARGRLEEAQGYYQQSLAVLREVQDRRGEGVDLGNLGQVAQARGRLEEAEGYFQQSLAIRREVQDRQGEGVDLGSLGQVAQARGRLEEAQGYYQQSLAVLREVQDRGGEGVVLSNLGQIALRRGQVEEAEGYFQQSLAIDREVQDRQGEGVDLGSLGQIALRRGQVEEAQGYFQQSLAIRREVQDRRGEGVVLSNLGQIARDTGKLDEAERYFRECLHLMRDVQDALNQGKISQILGEFLVVHRGKRAEGCELIGSAVSIFQQLDVPDEQEARELAASLGCDVE